MSTYISSIFIDPLVRQARRFSRPSLSRENSPSGFPSSQQYGAGAASASSTEDALDGGARLSGGRAGSRTVPQSPLQLAVPEDEGVTLVEAQAHTDEDSSVHTIASGERSSEDSLRSVGNRGRTDSDYSNNPSYGIPERFRMNNEPTPDYNFDGQRSSIPISGEASRTASRNESAQPWPGSYTGTVGSGSLPADDGMRLLRNRILDVQNMKVGGEEKARLVHGIMTERYKSSRTDTASPRSFRPRSPASLLSQEGVSCTVSDSAMTVQDNTVATPQSTFSTLTTDDPYNLMPEDLQPTYVPKSPSSNATNSTRTSSSSIDRLSQGNDNKQLGCQHYKRSVKLQCFTCKRWYTCRFCHDEVENHTLVRKDTENMLCMLCGTAQPAGGYCKNCNEQMARYYCGVCKLWDDDNEKSIYHCDDCGICRVGQGLGKDFFHCKVSSNKSSSSLIASYGLSRWS